MTSQEIGGGLFVAGYAALVALAIKTFGIRRVLGVLLGVAFLALVVAFKSLAVITGGRRY